MYCHRGFTRQNSLGITDFVEAILKAPGCHKNYMQETLSIVVILRKSSKIILMTFTLFIFIHLSCDQTLSQVHLCKPQYKSTELIIYYSRELTFDTDLCCLLHFTSTV